MAMNRRTFLKSTTLAAALPVGWAPQDRGASGANGRQMAPRLRLFRNATCRIQYGGKTWLLDPFLSDAGALPAFNNTPNQRPNPVVPLPVPARQIVEGIDATLLTHPHVDHWDVPARELLPKNVPLFTQPTDTARVREAGFTDVRQVDSTVAWEGTTIARTGGQHGRDAVGQRMGAVSGYVLKRADSPTVYIAGDTIWCPEVADAIRTHRPDVIVVNAGEAQFLEGGPIIMGVSDVVQVCEAAPQAMVVAVHMEAVNHCLLTRTALRAGLERAAVKSRIQIPKDGDEVTLA